jgi:hypothetical protein
MRRDQASKDRLKALVGETQPESSGTISGTNADFEGVPQTSEGAHDAAETAD